VGIEQAAIQWRKSSKSGHGSNNCVEMGTATTFDDVLVRDSKDRTGPVLSFGPRAWKDFVEFVTGDNPPRA
jgi:hypothetical protein